MAEVSDSLYVNKIDSTKVEKVKKFTEKIKPNQISKLNEEMHKAMIGLLIYTITPKQPKTQADIDSCIQKSTKELEATKRAMSK